MGESTQPGSPEISKSAVIPPSKRLVCVTGSIWTGSRSAPRHMLVRDGFKRPQWFTTDRRISDADFRHIAPGAFHMARANDELLSFFEYGGSWTGIFKAAFTEAMDASQRGVLVVGPPEIAAQLAERFPRAVLFSLKDPSMTISPQLEAALARGQLHRIDVEMLAAGAWSEADAKILEILGLSK